MLAILLATALAEPKAPPNSDYRWASASAVERWHDLKFGLRIHWGSYAIAGQGPESWPLNTNKGNSSFLKDWWQRPARWQPKAFDADEWMALMKVAGVKFFDFTTKHHEGFSMFDTSARLHDCWSFGENGSFDGIVPCPANHTFSSSEAFGRDVTGEIVAAARRASIVPGLYFSHIDWYDPDMRIDQWNPLGTGLCEQGRPCDPRRFNASSNATQWARFVQRHRAQVAEVLTKYGEIGELSFDMNFPPAFDEEMRRTVLLARSLAPRTLFRGRGMGGYKGACDAAREACGYGDYETPEEVFPASTVPGNWQVIFHGSAFMSYDPVGAHYVNGSFIVWHLVDIVAKGGLMQIGYGPDANGQFHPKAVEALQYAGRWLRTNGEALFATRAMPASWHDAASPMVRFTRSKDNATVYAHVLQGFGAPPLPADGKLRLACVRPVPGSVVTILGYEDEATRAPLPIAWEQQAEAAVLAVPTDLGAHPAVLAPAFVYKMRAPPAACQSPPGQSAPVVEA